MYEFWYDCLKPKYGENIRLCYMDKDSFIAYVKTDDIYKNVADVEKKVYSLNYQIDRPLPKGTNKKSNWTNERRIRRRSHERNLQIKSKNI